ncbi:MAG: TIGR00730 family Rossman fold protein [Rhodomicrobium sp.]|nr:TIGR00730 family Rossman fold protein [Rhodomicrobium sp.]
MKDNAIKNICVYCGSGVGASPIYAEAARQLGQAMAREGIGLVYGGAGVGLMGEIARSVMAAGGNVTGIRPPDLPINEPPFNDISELIEVKNLHERKMLMFERSDAFVALPGGVGTLEELVEQITWAQLGHHAKPILMADIDGYWTPLLDLFAQMRRLKFISPALDISYLVTGEVEEIIPMLREAARPGREARLAVAP